MGNNIFIEINTSVLRRKNKTRMMYKFSFVLKDAHYTKI